MKVKNIIWLLAVCFPFASLADKSHHKTSAVYSPACDELTLKTLAGEGLLSISKQQNWSNNSRGYILTLDLRKMDYTELTQKMMTAGCFSAPK